MFWKSKKKEIDNGIILLENNIKIDIQNGSEVEKQITMIHFSIGELQVIKNLQPFVEEKIDDIVNLSLRLSKKIYLRKNFIIPV